MTGNADFMQRVEKLLQDFQQTLNGENRRRRETASRFSVFESFGGEHSELVHSTFLKFLLEPAERHDQGDLFLSTFLEFLGMPFHQASTQGARVCREFDLNPFGRVDIRVRLTNGQIILIENKVRAKEGHCQIGGYLKWLKCQGAPNGLSHQIVFLTPEGRQPVSTTRPEDVVCVSYSRLANWVAASRERVEAPRLGVVLDHYADTCRLIGGTMRRDAMPNSIRQFFLDSQEPQRFETALELSSHVESYRRELYENCCRICRCVISELTGRLQIQGHAERWVVDLDNGYFGDSRFRDWTGWRIAWRARQGRPHFSVRVEYWPEKGLFYGVTRGFNVNTAGGQHPEDVQLQNGLLKEKYEPHNYWPGLRFFCDPDLSLPRFDPSRTDDVLKIHREFQKPDGLRGLTVRVADLVWELFDTRRPQLEELNDPWLYPDVE